MMGGLDSMQSGPMNHLNDQQATSDSLFSNQQPGMDREYSGHDYHVSQSEQYHVQDGHQKSQQPVSNSQHVEDSNYSSQQSQQPQRTTKKLPQQQQHPHKQQQSHSQQNQHPHYPQQVDHHLPHSQQQNSQQPPHKRQHNVQQSPQQYSPQQQHPRHQKQRHHQQQLQQQQQQNIVKQPKQFQQKPQQQFQPVAPNQTHQRPGQTRQKGSRPNHAQSQNQLGQQPHTKQTQHQPYLQQQQELQQYHQQSQVAKKTHASRSQKQRKLQHQQSTSHEVESTTRKSPHKERSPVIIPPKFQQSSTNRNSEDQSQNSFFKAVFGSESTLLEPPVSATCPFSPNRPPPSSIFPVSDKEDDEEEEDEEKEDEEEIIIEDEEQPRRLSKRKEKNNSKKKEIPAKISAIVSENEEVLASINKANKRMELEEFVLETRQSIAEAIKKSSKLSPEEKENSITVGEDDVSKYLSFLGSSQDETITPKEILEELKEKTKVEYKPIEVKKPVFQEKRPSPSINSSVSSTPMKNELLAHSSSENADAKKLTSGSTTGNTRTDLRKNNELQGNNNEKDEEELALCAELMPGGGSNLDHSSGEVYTIPEDANEASSPTTADGVSRPRRRGQ